MSGSHLCIPRNETVQPCYFQNIIRMFCLLVYTLIYLWEIYIFAGLVCLFCCSQICSRPILGLYKSLKTHEGRNWDWGRAISFLGVHKLNFQFSADSQCIASGPIGPMESSLLLHMSSSQGEGTSDAYDRGLILCSRLVLAINSAPSQATGWWRLCFCFT